MSSPFVAEIRIFGFNFAPKGWALCDGQLLTISQNTALFSLLGTTYGGDGKTTFALPDFQGATALNAGQGPGLSQRFLGEQSGTQTVTLLQSEMPAHNHGAVNLDANHFNANTSSPGSGAPGNASPHLIYSTARTGSATMNPSMLSVAGGNQPHNNMMPYLGLSFCIAMQGIFPPR